MIGPVAVRPVCRCPAVVLLAFPLSPQLVFLNPLHAVLAKTTMSAENCAEFTRCKNEERVGILRIGAKAVTVSRRRPGGVKQLHPPALPNSTLPPRHGSHGPCRHSCRTGPVNTMRETIEPQLWLPSSGAALVRLHSAFHSIML